MIKVYDKTNTITADLLVKLTFYQTCLQARLDADSGSPRLLDTLLAQQSCVFKHALYVFVQ